MQVAFYKDSSTIILMVYLIKQFKSSNYVSMVKSLVDIVEFITVIEMLVY